MALVEVGSVQRACSSDHRQELDQLASNPLVWSVKKCCVVMNCWFCGDLAGFGDRMSQINGQRTAVMTE